jgi:glutaredoxin
VWPRRPPRAVCIRSVKLYSAAGCHLCERARETLDELRAELGFELEEVEITGDPELEARYRELLPVVEIDGERAFTYFVQPDALRRKLSQSPGPRGSL